MVDGASLISVHRTFHGFPVPEGNEVSLLVWAPGTLHLDYLPLVSCPSGNQSMPPSWVPCLWVGHVSEHPPLLNSGHLTWMNSFDPHTNPHRRYGYHSYFRGKNRNLGGYVCHPKSQSLNWSRGLGSCTH